MTVTATAYEVWVDENGLTPNINDGFFDDPDNDGEPNIKEFAMNGNPLEVFSHCPLYPAIVTGLGTQIFTVTFPLRKGTEFSSGPKPEAEIDGIRYVVEGSDGLEDFDLPVEPYSLVIDDGLPPLPDNYEYRTFRTAGFVSENARAFVRVIIQPATLE